MLKNEFIKGMDISSYPEMMDKGYKYYDYDGREVNILDFAKEQGFNYGRLRIWNDPSNNEDGRSYCDLSHTKQMAKEIKRRGLGLLLDFHYSDWWADPGNQKKPRAWENLTGEALNKAVYDYTKEVLETLDENGTYPDMVQVGNEIRCGMLWPDGLTSNWDLLAALINAGIRAVRSTQNGRDVQIMLHLDQGGRYYYFKEWFDNAIARNVIDFDIIGLSYYPFWHGTFYDLKNTMESLVKRYNKPLIIAEMAHAYRKYEGSFFGEVQEKLAGFPASGEGQKEVLELLMSITANISDKKGLGVFYWEPFSRAEDEQDKDSWGICMSVVNMKGQATLGMKAFKSDPYQIDVEKNAKIYLPSMITVTIQDKPEEYLPEFVKVLKYDGRLIKKAVEWDFDKNKLIKNDICVVNGKLKESGETVVISIKLVDEKEDKNLLQNTRFENIYEGKPKQWDIHVEAAPECFIGEVHDKASLYYFKSSANFKLDLSQKVKNVPNGHYILSVLYQGDNTTGVNIKLYAEKEGQEADCNEIASTMIYPSDEDWTEYSFAFDYDGEGMLKVGLKVDAPAIYGKVKGFRLESGDLKSFQNQDSY